MEFLNKIIQYVKNLFFKSVDSVEEVSEIVKEKAPVVKKLKVKKTKKKVKKG
jgi:hypothetical protein|tara:strand:+ start:812 stop:967 length:156 start_codon:yes stop_codon:yes gene_type:complete